MQVEARLFGVLGDPVEHSLSPAMHNAAFAACGLPHLYLRYRVPSETLPAALAEARRLQMGGLNLTVPLKEVALPLCDAVTSEARRVGAVNTILFDGSRLVGDNTDAPGFARSLEGLVELSAADVILIGAGGSARAVGVALAMGGAARIIVANRTVPRAEELAARLADLGGPPVTAAPLDALVDGRILGTASLVVNTTSSGLVAEAIPVRYGATPPQCLFVDLVYGARPTPFLRGAARARRPILDGAAMLLHQGALAFEAWTGRPAPLEAMMQALGSAGLVVPRPRATTSRRQA